ncbi:MAG: methyltransferase dimerization domain-containing protein, partial [Dehalococcoidia bacterium]
MTDGSKSESLLRLGLGYWSSKAFLTACELKLFTLVHQGTDSVEEVARALAIPHRSARILMDAMASLDLLAKEGGSYKTTDLSSELLVEGTPAYMGDFFVAVNRMFYKPFVQFEQALREGRPVWSSDAEGRHQPVSREEAALLTRAMHGLGKLTAQDFGRSHNLSERTHLLDIGGGSGVMSIGAVQRNPFLEATVLDRPAVCEVA